MRIIKPARTMALAMLTAAPALADAAPVALPSGREVAFHDVVWGQPGPAGLAVRFRFLEANLGAVVDATPYEELEADMHFLCETYALDRISNTGPQPATVMISISDRPVAFGAPEPGAVQVFEAYRPVEGTCIWEGF